MYLAYGKHSKLFLGNLAIRQDAEYFANFSAMSTLIQVTLCAAAYSNLESDKLVEFEVEFIADVLPIDEEIGIGKSIIFFHDGGTANIMESAEEIMKRLEELNRKSEFLNFNLN